MSYKLPIFGLGKGKQKDPPKQIKKRRNVWEYEDEEPEIKEQTKKQNPQKTSEQKKPILNINHYESATMKKIPQYNSIQNNPLIVTNPTYEYENKLIDNVLETSGMIIKPTEGQLNEFKRRVKTLNNQIIFNLLNERLISSIDKDTKLLIKVLYVIEEIIKDKTNNGYIDLYKDNSRMFQQIYNKNYGKKINQLASDIHLSLTGTQLLPKVAEPIKQQPKFTPQIKINEPIGQKDKQSAIISKSNENNNNININENKQSFSFIKKKSTNKEPQQISQQQVTEDLFNFGQSNQSENFVNINNINEQNVQSDNKPKKGFGFIKNKNKEHSNQNQNIIQPQKEQNANLLLNDFENLNFNNNNNNNNNKNTNINFPPKIPSKSQDDLINLFNQTDFNINQNIIEQQESNTTNNYQTNTSPNNVQMPKMNENNISNSNSSTSLYNNLFNPNPQIENDIIQFQHNKQEKPEEPKPDPFGNLLNLLK